MPGLDGIELVRRMRGNLQTADIPVFMLTCNLYALTPEVLYDELHFNNVIPKGKLLGEVVVEMQYCIEDQVVECLATEYGVPPMQNLKLGYSIPRMSTYFHGSTPKKTCIIPGAWPAPSRSTVCRYFSPFCRF
jgi:hypothetical protein